MWDEGKKQLWERRRLPFYVRGSGKAPRRQYLSKERSDGGGGIKHVDFC